MSLLTQVNSDTYLLDQNPDIEILTQSRFTITNENNVLSIKDPYWKVSNGIDCRFTFNGIPLNLLLVEKTTESDRKNNDENYTYYFEFQDGIDIGQSAYLKLNGIDFISFQREDPNKLKYIDSINKIPSPIKLLFEKGFEISRALPNDQNYLDDAPIVAEIQLLKNSQFVINNIRFNLLGIYTNITEIGDIRSYALHYYFSIPTSLSPKNPGNYLILDSISFNQMIRNGDLISIKPKNIVESVSEIITEQ